MGVIRNEMQRKLTTKCMSLMTGLLPLVVKEQSLRNYGQDQTKGHANELSNLEHANKVGRCRIDSKDVLDRNLEKHCLRQKRICDAVLLTFLRVLNDATTMKTITAHLHDLKSWKSIPVQTMSSHLWVDVKGWHAGLPGPALSIGLTSGSVDRSCFLQSA